MVTMLLAVKLAIVMFPKLFCYLFFLILVGTTKLQVFPGLNVGICEAS